MHSKVSYAEEKRISPRNSFDDKMLVNEWNSEPSKQAYAHIIINIDAQ
jgi:hypothetical protein